MDNFNQWSITYRPKTLDEVYGYDHIKDFAKNCIKHDNWPRGILLMGKYGSGKTTIAKILAKTYVCKHLDENGNPCNQCPDCLSVDKGLFNRDIKMLGADALKKDDMNADSIKEAVKVFVEKAMQAPFFGSKRKVIIFDEVQSLLASKGTIDSFLTALEKENSKTYWIFTSMESIPDCGFTSRLMKLNFNEQSHSGLVKYLFEFSKRVVFNDKILWDYLLEEAGKEFVTQGFLQIAKSSNGSIRTATNILQECIDSKRWDPAQIAIRFGNFVESDIMDAFYLLASNNKSDNLLKALAQIDNNNYKQFIFFSASYIKDAEMAKHFGKLVSLTKDNQLNEFGSGDFRFDKALQLSKAPNYDKLKNIIMKYSGATVTCKDLLIAELLNILD